MLLAIYPSSIALVYENCGIIIYPQVLNPRLLPIKLAVLKVTRIRTKHLHLSNHEASPRNSPPSKIPNPIPDPNPPWNTTKCTGPPGLARSMPLQINWFNTKQMFTLGPHLVEGYHHENDGHCPIHCWNEHYKGAGHHDFKKVIGLEFLEDWNGWFWVTKSCILWMLCVKLLDSYRCWSMLHHPELVHQK